MDYFFQMQADFASLALNNYFFDELEKLPEDIRYAVIYVYYMYLK